MKTNSLQGKWYLCLLGPLLVVVVLLPITVRAASIFAPALVGLHPQPGDCGMLLGFDTDTSNERVGYGQFFGREALDPFARMPESINTTLYLTRHGDSVRLAARLDYLASPQKDGFRFLGLAKYVIPIRVNIEDTGEMSNIGYDYTRVWVSRTRSGIAAAKANVVRKMHHKYLKDRDDGGYGYLDHQRVDFVANGFYVTAGYWARITGGATFFDAEDLQSLVALYPPPIAPALKAWVPTTTINKAFKKVIEEDSFAGADPANDAVFSFRRVGGQTNLLGLLLIPGNSARSFFEPVDLGIAPVKLIKQPPFPLNFAAFQRIDPTVYDVYISPNQNTVVVLTKKDLIAIDVATGNELYRAPHHCPINKILLTEWAVGGFVAKWEDALK